MTRISKATWLSLFAESSRVCNLFIIGNNGGAEMTGNFQLKINQYFGKSGRQALPCSDSENLSQLILSGAHLYTANKQLSLTICTRISLNGLLYLYGPPKSHFQKLWNRHSSSVSICTSNLWLPKWGKGKALIIQLSRVNIIDICKTFIKRVVQAVSGFYP